MSKEPTGEIYQFRIELLDIEPTIWRRIQVPADYSFWDLHVALQDAMGWLDCHLHSFLVKRSKTTREEEIGIPFDDDKGEVMPGWAVGLGGVFTQPGLEVVYLYDSGDGWGHTVMFEDILPREKGMKYPRCIGGERACPPEDCGGVQGYQELLEIISDPNDPEYETMTSWLKNHLKNYHPYNPDEFDPAQVTFDDPSERFEKAFG